MDTKWKNIKKKEVWKKGSRTVWEFLRKKEIRLILCVICLLISFMYMNDIISDYQSITLYMISKGAIMNVFLGVGAANGISYVLERFSRWELQSPQFYEKWKKRGQRQQLCIAVIVLIAFLAAVSYFKSVMHTYYWNMNYSRGYVMVGTVLVQVIICEIVVISYMRKILNRYMMIMQEVNQRNLEAAIQSEKLKVDLISNVSHDLKTPLTSMVGYIELIKKEELSDTVSDYVEVLSKKAGKLKEMIDSLFDLAKTSSGNVNLKMESMELNRLIEQIQADMEDRIRESGREIIVELTSQDTGFVSDSSYMYRICQNLMENALKYSQESTRIFIKTEVIYSEPEHAFADNGAAETGIGRDKEIKKRQRVRFEITNTSSYRMNFTREQIVERFVRGDEARTTEGNGLGLAIVNTYTAALGGSFDVHIDCDQFKAAVEFPAGYGDS